MLAKKYRLNLSLENNSSIFSRGNSLFVTSEHFLVHLRPNETHLQIACLTPKAAISTASSRNYYRRFMYSLVEKKIRDAVLSVSTKFDLVLILKKKFSEDKDILKNDFSVLIQKVKTQMDSN